MVDLEDLFYDDTVQLINEYCDKIIEQLRAKIIINIDSCDDNEYYYVSFDVYLPYDFTRDTIISSHKKADLTITQMVLYDDSIKVIWKGFRILFFRA